MSVDETRGSNEPIRGLDPRHYTDPVLWARERDRILCRTWHYACHVAQVAEAGGYVCLRIADQGVFVVRGDDGVLRAFYNVCQHRAHELLAGEGRAARLTCPYHGWTYRLDGRLRGAPGTRGVKGFDPGAIRLSAVRLEVLGGFVFVNLDAEARPMADWYGDVEADLRAAVPGIDGYRPVREHHAEEDCNWKVAVENYNECYHCRIVHPSFTRGVLDPASVEIHPRDHTVRHTGRAVAGADASYAFGADADRYFAFYLWPAFSVQVYPGRAVNTYWWRPLRVDRTRVHRGWLAPAGASDREVAAIAEFAELDRRTTFAEDLPVVNTVQRGLASRGYRPGPLVVNPAGGVETEESLAAIHGWVRAALGG